MKFVVTTPDEIDAAMANALLAAASAVAWLQAEASDPLKLLFRAKFELVGFHPFDNRALNLVEQINQTWSLVTALEAARLLLDRHPDANGFSLAPGAHAAQELDLMSVAPGLVGAEIFAATSPASNNKLSKDLARLSGRSEHYRYSIFMSPKHPRTERLQRYERDGIEVWSIAPPMGLMA